MPAGNVSNSSTPPSFRDASTLWWLLCPPVYLLGHSPPLRHAQGSTPTGVFEDGSRPLIATIRQWTKIRHWVRYPLPGTQCYQSFLLGMDLEYSLTCLTYYQELCIFSFDLPGLFDLTTTTIIIIIIIIEICKAPTLLLKALNKHSIMYIESIMLYQ